MIHSRDVDDKSKHGRNEHEFRVDFVLAAENTLDRHVEEYTGHHPYHEDGGQSADHLGSVPSERHTSGGRSRPDPQGEQRYHEATEIGQQMRGVCGDGQTAGQNAPCKNSAMLASRAQGLPFHPI